MPTSYESSAAAIAQRIEKLIAQINKLNDEEFLAVRISIRHEHQQCASAAKTLFDNMVRGATKNEKTYIDNYYYLYLLQQAARFNQFYNKVESITYESDSDAVINTDKPVGDLLRKHKILPFSHQLLARHEPVNMTVVVSKHQDHPFREHHLDADYRKYYNEKTAPSEAKHQDHDHYFKANYEIGKATQQTFFSPYFSPADDSRHQLDKNLFQSAIKHIQAGEDLTADESNVLRFSHYYRHPLPAQFAALIAEDKPDASTVNHRVTHLGHASELIEFTNAVNLMIAIDPINFQSGTEGFLISNLARIAYPRRTAPALATKDYPATNVVLISHNHFDHMCFKTMRRAFSARNTLFIVPAGDGKRMRKHGFENVVELASWNHFVKIRVETATKTAEYEISAFPAKHASNRSVNDLYQSLYMGFMIRDCSKDHYVLCTGDTGILDNEHYLQLESQLRMRKLFIKTACIASGPDRPRSWMECTHQSTADAIVMHAKFTKINAAVALQMGRNQTLHAAAPKAIGYHQGCFRLGLLTYQDVNTTITRMLAVMKTLRDITLNELTLEVLQANTFYHFMDKFEQKALWELMQCYFARNRSVNEIIELIENNFFVPQPGATYTGQQFEFDYETLIQNRDPLASHAKFKMLDAPYEYFARLLPPELYQVEVDKKEMLKALLAIYLHRPLSINRRKRADITEFATRLLIMHERDIPQALGILYAKIFPKQDEGIRDEGHTHTMLTIAAGLMYFDDFREAFYRRHCSLLKPVEAVQPRLARYP